jgi:pimeloyl-ACP methyl ester carboxylesterase
MALHWIDRMAVEVDGDGDAVVMVHGLGGTTNTWTSLAPALAGAQRIRIDLPGSGRSHKAYALRDNAPDAGHLTIDILVDAVLRVCGELRVTKAHFVAHSLGTIVCQHLAVRAPERVRSLALFGALPAPPEPARQALRQRAERARSEGMFGIADAIVQAALSASTREQLPVTVAFVRESLLSQDPEGYARTCEALASAQPAAIEQIRVPTLLVAGDEDAVAPVQVARDMARRISDATVETLARCGHWMTVERAGECQSYLKRFLERAYARA